MGRLIHGPQPRPSSQAKQPLEDRSNAVPGSRLYVDEVQMFLLVCIAQAGLTLALRQKKIMKRMKVYSGLMKQQTHHRVLNQKTVE